ncbi:hypothetical protein ABH937_002420 [Kitasatospora sp. GAS1066B]
MIRSRSRASSRSASSTTTGPAPPVFERRRRGLGRRDGALPGIPGHRGRHRLRLPPLRVGPGDRGRAVVGSGRRRRGHAGRPLRRHRPHRPRPGSARQPGGGRTGAAAPATPWSKNSTPARPGKPCAASSKRRWNRHPRAPPRAECSGAPPGAAPRRCAADDAPSPASQWPQAVAVSRPLVGLTVHQAQTAENQDPRAPLILTGSDDHRSGTTGYAEALGTVGLEKAGRNRHPGGGSAVQAGPGGQPAPGASRRSSAPISRSLMLA